MEYWSPPAPARCEPPPRGEVECRLIGIIAEELRIDRGRICPQTRMLEDLGIDSLEMVELLMAAESEFGITIPDGDSWPLGSTIADLATLVLRQWHTGQPDRPEWRADREPMPAAEEMAFTQLGGRLNGVPEGPLFESIGRNLEGYAQYRRQIDGMRCILLDSELLIDAEPVSNQAYARFLDSIPSISETVLRNWYGGWEDDRRREHNQLVHAAGGWQPVCGAARHPVVMVSWLGANAYSLWANGYDYRYYRGDGSIDMALSAPSFPAPPASRGWSLLPTEAEWERAAGTGAAANSVAGRHQAGAMYGSGTLPSAPVNARLGMSPRGLHHVTGNVWQWCQDAYEGAKATEDPRVECGGSWVGPFSLLGARRGRPALARGRCLGFRCVSLLRP